MIDEQKQREIRKLYLEGVPIAEIARRLGVNRRTATRYARSPTVNVGRISAYRPHLDRRLAAGERNLSRLYEELVSLGFKGHKATITRYIKRWLKENGGNPQMMEGMDSSIPGREEEIGRLMEWSRVAFAEQPIIGVIAGEQGTGKSYLVEGWASALPAQEPAVEIIQVRCWSHFNPISFGVFIGVLRQFFALQGSEPLQEQVERFRQKIDTLVKDKRIHPADVEAVESVLGIVRHAEQPTLEQFQMQSLAIARLLTAYARHVAPLCIVIDDAHWMDDAAMRLMETIIKEWDSSRLIMVLSTHPLLLDRLSFRVKRRSGYRMMNLGALPEEATPTLVVRHFPRAKRVHPNLLNFLHEQSRGNALHLEELLQLLKRQDLVIETDEGLELAEEAEQQIPSKLHSLLVERATRLSSELKRVCQAASVVGRGFGPKMLLHFVDHDGLLRERILELQAEGYFTSGESHNLESAEGAELHPMQSVALYRHLTRSARRMYHTKVAGVLNERMPDRPDVLPAIAYHQARAGQPREAVDAYFKAGDHEAINGSPACIPLFREALRIVEKRLDDLEYLTSALVRLIGAYVRFGRVLEARPLLSQYVDASEMLDPQSRKEHAWLESCMRIDLFLLMGTSRDQLGRISGFRREQSEKQLGLRYHLLSGHLDHAAESSLHLKSWQTGEWARTVYGCDSADRFWTTYQKILSGRGRWSEVNTLQNPYYDRAVSVNARIERGEAPEESPLGMLSHAMLHHGISSNGNGSGEAATDDETVRALILAANESELVDRATIGLALKYFLPEGTEDSRRILDDMVNAISAWPTKAAWEALAEAESDDPHAQDRAIRYIHQRLIMEGISSPLWQWQVQQERSGMKPKELETASA